jgi:Skp family chaperone for outer membrane proteins
MDHASRLHEGVHERTEPCDPPALADNLAIVLVARYAALLNSWDGEITSEFAAKIKFLRDLTRDVTQLQKSLHRAAQQTRDLDRERKADAAEDLAAAKQAAAARLMADSRCRTLANFTGGEVAHHRVAVETAASPREVAAVLDRFLSESIQPNPTKISLSASPAASETPQNRAAA